MERDSSGPRQWDGVARALHWSMALLILGMIALGWIAVSYPLSPTKLTLFLWHKSIGLSLLGLVVVRLLWRAATRAPAPPESTSGLERALARSSHAMLYLLMILMPVSGYVVNSTADFSFRFFGWARVPNLIAPNKGWQDAAETVHLTTSWILILLIVVHAAAALRHHFVLKNDVLAGMLPFAGRSGQGSRGP